MSHREGSENKGSAFPSASSGKLVKRAEAARMLGMSVSTLRRREGELVNPIIGPDGVHLFDEAELRSVSVTIRHSRAVASIGPGSGDVAAHVFALLDEGVHPVEIVKNLRLPPDVVMALQDQWARMREGFVVSHEQASDLALLARGRVAKSAAEAIDTLRARIAALLRLGGSSKCRFCGDQSACICERCVIQTRGPLWTLQVELERQTDQAGAEQVRVVAEVCWDDTLDGEGACGVAVRSDWYPRVTTDRSPIADFIEALDQR
jgi:hypothetical protein